ncbi:hypothetical protein RWK44_05320 [Rhizobium sp. 25PS6]|nr:MULTISPECIES: hypothetical protein [Rhizobium]MDU0359830.1 hypothetical protein [Rhizobium sp. 25PS6]
MEPVLIVGPVCDDVIDGIGYSVLKQFQTPRTVIKIGEMLD